MKLTINRAEPAPPPINSVVLTLTEHEAKMLEAVMAGIFGWDNPEREIRNFVDRLHGDLRDAGLTDVDMRNRVRNKLFIHKD